MQKSSRRPAGIDVSRFVGHLNHDEVGALEELHSTAAREHRTNRLWAFFGCVLGSALVPTPQGLVGYRLLTGTPSEAGFGPALVFFLLALLVAYVFVRMTVISQDVRAVAKAWAEPLSQTPHALELLALVNNYPDLKLDNRGESARPLRVADFLHAQAQVARVAQNSLLSANACRQLDLMAGQSNR